MTMAATASSSGSTRIPIKLSAHLFSNTGDKTHATYHALHRDGTLELGGATLRSGGNGNGSSSATISLAAEDGTKLSGRMHPSDENDYVLLYDDASRSYILHKVSSVSHLLPSSSGSAGKATSPSSRSKADKAAEGTTYSPSIARTPQSTNSPSLASTSRKPASKIRDSLNTATASGTAKKAALHHNKKSGYDSSPTPSVPSGTPASYGLGISTAASSGPSPSFKNGNPAGNKGKAPVQDVEEFDMGSNSDEDLLVNALELPPSQAPVPLTSAKPSAPQAGTAQRYPGQKPPGPQQQKQQNQHQSQQHQLPSATSTSLSMLSNQDVVMSEESSEDEGDFEDLANDLESSLVGQGPFARSASGGGVVQHSLISSDDEDDDEDSDFVNALHDQKNNTSASSQQQQQQQASQRHFQPAQNVAAIHQQQRPQTQHVPPQQRPPPVQQQQTQPARPTQAGKKLPTARKYDSDIASSSESDDDSD